MKENPGYSDNARVGQDAFGFNPFWYIFLLIIAVGYIALCYHHGDVWSFLGIGMGVSTWSYLAIVLVGGVPLDIIVR